MPAVATPESEPGRTPDQPGSQRGHRGLLAARFLPAHLLALVAVGVAVWLGSWQWRSWEDGRAAAAQDLSAAEPIPVTEALGPDDPFPADRVGQPVRVVGTWVPEGTVYVEPREHEGEPGIWAVTPVSVDGAGGSALLVVRGWVGSVRDAPAPPTGEAELTAWLQPPEGSGAVDDDPTDDVLPQLRIADAIQHVDQDLFGAYAVARRDADLPTTGADGTEGLQAVAAPRPADVGGFTSVRNLLYAAEWWVFAGFAVFLWWRYLADQRAGLRETGDDERLG